MLSEPDGKHVGRRAVGCLKLVLILLLASLGWQARASDPVGIYGYIDKVVLEPSESSPERIQLFGGFTLAEGNGYQYSPAKKGVLYYSLNTTKPEACLKEWKDLKSLAGTGQIISFGTRYSKKGKIRAGDAKLESPDVYPLGFGITKVKESDYEPVKDLVQLRKKTGSPQTGIGKGSSKNGSGN